MSTFRHARLLAATGAALTALALTACENGSGSRDEGASKSASPTATKDASKPAQDRSSQQPTQNTGSGQPSAQSSRAGKPAQNDTGDKSGKNDDPYAPGNLASCNGSNTRTTAQPVSRPLNHMLLTVTNTGSKPCALMYYPVLRFDDMQWVPQAIGDSKPQAVTTLKPGESGYAGVRLSAADGSGTGGDTGRKLTIGFQGRTPNSSGGPAATPALPAKGVHYDSALSVTYWQTDAETALN